MSGQGELVTQWAAFSPIAGGESLSNTIHPASHRELSEPGELRYEWGAVTLLLRLPLLLLLWNRCAE